jgi:hypothetical protein
MITVVKIVKFQGQYLGCLDKVIIMSVLVKPKNYQDSHDNYCQNSKIPRSISWMS